MHEEILKVYFNKWIEAIGPENFSFFRKNHLLTDVSKQAWFKLSIEKGKNQDIWSYLGTIKY